LGLAVHLAPQMDWAPQHCEGVSVEVSEGLVAVAECWAAEVRSVLWSLLRPARQAARLMVRRLQDRVQALQWGRDRVRFPAQARLMRLRVVAVCVYEWWPSATKGNLD
jgi:hypothetical protein